MSFSTDDLERLTEGQKHEVVHRAQRVVNEVQIRQLSDIIELLDDVLDDPQKRYYIVIDRLDENWVEDRIRYLLIRALLETVRDFRKIRHAKIIVALRVDLLDRVLRLTRDPGFQEEKYKSLYLPISWQASRLVELLDARVNRLVRSRYSERESVTHRDVLPKSIGKQSASDYLVSRTLLRPRDIISFFNHCIAHAVDSPRITVEMLRLAEHEYSRERLDSLTDEWFADYPNLSECLRLLKRRPATFRVADISIDDLADFLVDFISGPPSNKDILSEAAQQVLDGVMTEKAFISILLQIFYRVGVIGLKLEPHESVLWGITGHRSISVTEITPRTGVSVHPCFWMALGVKPPA